MITAVQRLRHLWSFADLINHHIKNEVRNGWVPGLHTKSLATHSSVAVLRVGGALDLLEAS